MEEIAFKSRIVTIGLFRCKPWEPRFADSGPIRDYIVVFPRTGVTITHAGRDPIVASPNVVMYYNRGQLYRRGKISERGDICEWFAFDRAILLEALRAYDRTVDDRVDKPFYFTHGPSDPTSYLLQRMIVEHLLGHEHPDQMFVEETLLWVLDRAIENTFRYWDGISNRSSPPARSEHTGLARDIQRLLAARFQEPLSLTQIAAEVNYSPYHLCRVFRAYTGFSIHRYLDQIRLRTALEAVTAGAQELTDLALTLGYSSHSHFTQSFRRAFGHPPSAVRRFSAAHHLKSLRASLNQARF